MGDGVEIEVPYQRENLPADLATILPIVDRNGSGSVTIADIEIADPDDVAGANIGPSDVRLTEVQDAATGRLLFFATNDLVTGDTFALPRIHRRTRMDGVRAAEGGG